ncbi:hypothetical protein TUBRATIS_000460 [Tubulinosema ratisbonensis]|uniref:Uncharacterized protein n=1 Tax=Tubulinosema ratisbonensis TaxID=291195 RepID=A0A437AQL8_9MICR|nr:hypothetical protein TUBRATIS_000460 [Tubulinosema ratisbonensis]
MMLYFLPFCFNSVEIDDLNKFFEKILASSQNIKEVQLYEWENTELGNNVEQSDVKDDKVIEKIYVEAKRFVHHEECAEMMNRNNRELNQIQKYLEFLKQLLNFDLLNLLSSVEENLNKLQTSLELHIKVFRIIKEFFSQLNGTKNLTKRESVFILTIPKEIQKYNTVSEEFNHSVAIFKENFTTFRNFLINLDKEKHKTTNLTYKCEGEYDIQRFKQDSIFKKIVETPEKIIQSLVFIESAELIKADIDKINKNNFLSLTQSNYDKFQDTYSELKKIADYFNKLNPILNKNIPQEIKTLLVNFKGSLEYKVLNLNNLLNPIIKPFLAKLKAIKSCIDSFKDEISLKKLENEINKKETLIQNEIKNIEKISDFKKSQISYKTTKKAKKGKKKARDLGTEIGVVTDAFDLNLIPYNEKVMEFFNFFKSNLEKYDSLEKEIKLDILKPDFLLSWKFLEINFKSNFFVCKSRCISREKDIEKECIDSKENTLASNPPKESTTEAKGVLPPKMDTKTKLFVGEVLKNYRSLDKDSFVKTYEGNEYECCFEADLREKMKEIGKKAASYVTPRGTEIRVMTLYQ